MYKKHLKRLHLAIVLCGLTFTSLAGAEQLPKQEINQKLFQQLPDAIKQSGQIVAVNDGSVPPYIIYENDGHVTGATIELFEAIGSLLNVTIKHETTTGISGVLMGVQSGRYDMAIGPIGDLPDRQVNNDFIDYAASYSAFLVPKGNPLNIHGLADTCGKRIAVTVGAHGIKELTDISEVCQKEDKPIVNILTFKDQPTAVLAVKSDRADAFNAGVGMLSYFVSQAKDELELAGTRKPEEPAERFYAAVVGKNAPLGPVIFEAFKELFANGTYAAIMQKWGLETSALSEPGMNLAK